MNPSAHAQLDASTHPEAHSESGRHARQMAAPPRANVSGGHGSWCVRPRQYSPSAHPTHADPLCTVPAAQGAHPPPPLRMTYPASHSHADAPAPLWEWAKQSAHAPRRE